MSNFIQSLLKEATVLVGDVEAGFHPPSRPGPDASVDELLAYKPTTLADAVVHLQQLHEALGAVSPDDSKTIGKIFVAIGALIESFFPQWQQEGVFLIDLGTALEQGGPSGQAGPIRLGNTGYTISWAPWQQGPALESQTEPPG